MAYCKLWCKSLKKVEDTKVPYQKADIVNAMLQHHKYGSVYNKFPFYRLPKLSNSGFDVGRDARRSKSNLFFMEIEPSFCQKHQYFISSTKSNSLCLSVLISILNALTAILQIPIRIRCELHSFSNSTLLRL